MNENVLLKEKLKMILFISIIAFSFVLLLFVQRSHNLDPKNIRMWVMHYGVWAPIAFLVIYSAKSLVFFIPAGVLMLAAGLTFGVIKGGILLVIGTLLSSTLGFLFARYLGKDYVQKKIDGHFEDVKILFDQKAFLIILLLRLIPMLPYDVLNYLCGISKIKFRQYFFATFLGTIPACFLYAYLGANILNPHTKEFLLSLMFVIIISLVPLIFAKKYMAIFNKVKNKSE